MIFRKIFDFLGGILGILYSSKIGSKWPKLQMPGPVAHCKDAATNIVAAWTLIDAYFVISQDKFMAPNTILNYEHRNG